jgi:hypothetical protein
MGTKILKPQKFTKKLVIFPKFCSRVTAHLSQSAVFEHVFEIKKFAKEIFSSPAKLDGAVQYFIFDIPQEIFEKCLSFLQAIVR